MTSSCSILFRNVILAQQGNYANTNVYACILMIQSINVL